MFKNELKRLGLLVLTVSAKIVQMYRIKALNNHTESDAAV